uniref:Reverse transcriptase domain-containing protein n=1 Tax=Amphimedon queenslandica TaxID=400682 RepID=A0A1X7V7R6_AMPQE
MFRTYRIALTADIEKASLNTSVAVSDRDVLRFLRITEENEAEYDIQVLRFTRVGFGVSSSPFLLNATIRKHVEGYSKGHSPMIAKFVNSFYVDNMVCGAEEEEEALELYQNSKELMKDGGLIFGSFLLILLNCRYKLMRKREVPEREQKRNLCQEHTREDPTTSERRAQGLGVLWDVCQDELVFNLNAIAREAMESEPTKRKVISIVSKFFDPLGICVS